MSPPKGDAGTGEAFEVKNAALEIRGFAGGQLLDSRSDGVFWSVVCPVVFFLALVGLSPLSSAVQLGGDEHFELLKASAVLSGAVPYRDFWNDQPPGLTYWLAGLFWMTGESVLTARLLVVGLMATMLFGLQQTWRGSRLYGLVFVLLLIGAPQFLKLSQSVMADPTKLPLCVLAYVLACLAMRRRSVAMSGFSGFLFGAAVMVKFTAVLYLPGLLLTFWFGLEGLSGHQRRRIVSAFLFGGSLWLPYFFWLLLSYGEQLLGGHFTMVEVEGEVLPGDFAFGWHHVWPGLALWLGGLGACSLVVARKLPWHRLGFPIAALVVHVAFALFHVPWWDYYLLDLWFALSWLSAEAVCWAWGDLQRLRRHPLIPRPSKWIHRVRLALIILVSTWLIVGATLNVASSVKEFQETPRIQGSPIVQYLRNRPPANGEVMFTNQPILAFHGGWLLPADLSVLSLKRFWSGNQSVEEVVKTLRRFDVALAYFGGPIEEVAPAYVKYAEAALGNSERLGDGVLFTKRGDSSEK